MTSRLKTVLLLSALMGAGPLAASSAAAQTMSPAIDGAARAPVNALPPPTLPPNLLAPPVQPWPLLPLKKRVDA